MNKTAEERIAEVLRRLPEYRADGNLTGVLHDIECILKPPPKRHTVGGVVWEEISCRVPRAGEWALVNGLAVMVEVWESPATILRPVEIFEPGKGA